MNIEEVDRWLKDQYGISYTELGNEFNGASELLSKKYKEIERLNNIINEALGIANERFNYYSHYKSNNEEHLEDWENIFNVLLRRDN